MEHPKSSGGGVAIAALVAGLVMATPATADPKHPVFPNLQPMGKTQANVTIHKLAGDPNAEGDPHNGAPWDRDPKNTPIDNVRFDLYAIACGTSADNLKVVDLDTDEGWSNIKGLKATRDASGVFEKNGGDGTICKLNNPDKVERDTYNIRTAATVGEYGTTVYNISHRAYYVVEEPDSRVETPIEPFILTVPQAYTPAKNETRAGYTQAGWLYEISVYPKNKVKDREPTKEPVLDSITYALPDGTVVTDPQLVTWKLTLPLNQSAEVEKGPYKSLYFIDSLPDTLGYAGYDDNAMTLISAGTRYPIGKGHYTVESCTTADCTATDTLATYTDEKNPGSRFIKVTVDDAVLGVLSVGDDIEFNLKTRVREANVKPEVNNVTNSVSYVVNNTTKTVKTYKDSKGGTQPSTLNYGTIDVNKYMKDAPNTKLAGAKFDLYVAAKKGDKNAVAVPDLKDTYGLKVDTKTSGSTAVQYTTAAGGKFETGPIKVLLGTGNDADETYYLVETNAPAGYELGATNTYPINFTGVAAKIQPVANARKNIDETAGLPITGAQGLMLLTLGGAAIVMVGVGSVMVIRRRQEQD